MGRMIRAVGALKGDPEVGAAHEELATAEVKALRPAEGRALDEVAEPEPPTDGGAAHTEPGADP